MGQILVTAPANNKNNIFIATFNAAAKTLTISNNTVYDLQFGDLLSVYNVTRTAFFNFENMDANSFTQSKDSNGFPTFIWTFDSIPASSANGDTLQIMLGCPDVFMDYTILQVIAGATI